MPAMATEITPLKAVAEPMLTKERMMAMMVVAATALTGIEVRVLTWISVSSARALC
jgi:hypothetical protein